MIHRKTSSHQLPAIILDKKPIRAKARSCASTQTNNHTEDITRHGKLYAKSRQLTSESRAANSKRHREGPRTFDTYPNFQSDNKQVQLRHEHDLTGTTIFQISHISSLAHQPDKNISTIHNQDLALPNMLIGPPPHSSQPNPRSSKTNYSTVFSNYPRSDSRPRR